MIPVIVVEVHVPGGGRGHGARGARRRDSRGRKRHGGRGGRRHSSRGGRRYSGRGRKRHGGRGGKIHAVAGHGGRWVGVTESVLMRRVLRGGKHYWGERIVEQAVRQLEIVMGGKCPCQLHKGVKLCKGKDCGCKAVWAETGGDCWKCKSGKEKYPKLKFQDIFLYVHIFLCVRIFCVSYFLCVRIFCVSVFFVCQDFI